MLWGECTDRCVIQLHFQTWDMDQSNESFQSSIQKYLDLETHQDKCKYTNPSKVPL